MNKAPLLLGFPEYAPPAERLAEALAADFQIAEVHRFPDGESKVRIPERLPEHVIMCRSLDRANDKLIELMLAVETARGAGAERVTLVAPYLCYMRQDTAFAPGEAVSQRIIGAWLGRLFDAVVTVDPHLHRVNDFGSVIPGARAVSLSAAALMANFLRARLTNPVLIGPDSESRQWLAKIAQRNVWDYVIASKQRVSDTEVHISLPQEKLRNRSVVIIDDIASTGHTLAVTARQIRQAGAASIHCLVTHPLFVGDAEQMLRAAGIDQLWSSDSIIHPSNSIELAELLAEPLRG